MFLHFFFQCIDNGIAIISAEYLEKIEKKCPRPSIRVIVSRLLTDADIEEAFNVLQKVSSEVLA
jgi:serine palmitoyltransferase